jgi:hypothetical protein
LAFGIEHDYRSEVQRSCLKQIPCRLTEKAICAIWHPSDWEILAEHEHMEALKGGSLTKHASRQLELQSLAYSPGGEVAGLDGMNGDSEEYRDLHSQDSSDERWLNE